ncbi:hypothetical protein [Bacillus subtilis]|uniref:hypothetical protein n=1 Tax=Bacillus subtilis TaxID=1423 RepID=UPI0002FF3EE7|nr:hypothetical protein [Bacillus subtilis]MEC0284605.1 hypothetical protein [Bacillus subtilis]MEC0318549.1 hypothetical protein [Bacillus subtilis]MEC0325290.1 hypothetical protein [Bacillus subtilis]MEC0350300.1 hypothetical protein [Bacillus subtilis]MEC0354293.1 hypothetical protein [Bacillus subtilis]
MNTQQKMHLLLELLPVLLVQQFMMALKPLEIGWENKQTKLMHNLYIVQLLLENMHVI